MATDTGRWHYSPHPYTDPVVAQRTRPVHFPGALSEAEVKALLDMAVTVRDAGGATLRRPAEGGEYRTTWLQAAPLPAKARAIIGKLVELMVFADCEAGWQLLQHGSEHQVRCVEFHECEAVGASEEGVSTGAPSWTHYDAGSLVTLDLMLSRTANFDGGSFSTLEADGKLQPHVFERGDCLVFVSHKYHHVTPVRSGTRSVLVIELWRGPARSCAHRCLNPTGECHFSRAEVDGKECNLLPWVGDDG